MVTRSFAAIIFIFFKLFLIVRVLSDVPGQSAGDLVDGLSKAEEEVIVKVGKKRISPHTLALWFLDTPWA